MPRYEVTVVIEEIDDDGEYVDQDGKSDNSFGIQMETNKDPVMALRKAIKAGACGEIRIIQFS